MTEILLRAQEDEQAEPYLLWDSTWDATNMWADWSVVLPTAAANPGGLTSELGIETAVVIALFTWARAEDYEVDPGAYTDHQGWWGDGIDLEGDEQAMGSKLWLLLRSVLDNTTANKAIDYAKAALQPLITQGAAARIDVTATSDIPNNRLDLIVMIYGQDGSIIYKQSFALLWSQTSR